MHHGEVAMRKVRDIVKPAGEEVILAHRLLKNSLRGNEYIMMSKDFFTLSGGIENQEHQTHVENYEGIGNVETMVYYPNPPADLSHIKTTLWDKIVARHRLGTGTVVWAFKWKKRQDFKSLEDV